MDLALIILRGTAAAKPAAASLPNGALYFETDTLLTFENVAATWQTFSGPPGVVGGISTTVTTASLVGKTMTFTDGVLTDFS